MVISRWRRASCSGDDESKTDRSAETRLIVGRSNAESSTSWLRSLVRRATRTGGTTHDDRCLLSCRCHHYQLPHIVTGWLERSRPVRDEITPTRLICFGVKERSKHVPVCLRKAIISGTIFVCITKSDKNAAHTCFPFIVLHAYYNIQLIQRQLNTGNCC